MARRYELSNCTWTSIRDLISTTKKTGRPRNDDRLMFNGVLWIVCSGAAWRDLPERFGAWSTVYQRYRDWRDDGTFERVLDRLRTRLNEEGMIDMETWALDPVLFKCQFSYRGLQGRGGGGEGDDGVRCRVAVDEAQAARYPNIEGIKVIGIDLTM